MNWRKEKGDESVGRRARSWKGKKSDIPVLEERMTVRGIGTAPCWMRLILPVS